MTRLSPALPLLVVALLGWPTLGACGGDDAAAEPVPTIVDTGDTEIPFVVADEDGWVWIFHAESPTRPTGVTIFHPDGREGHLTVDPDTKEALHWVSQGYVYTFNAWRLNLRSALSRPKD